MNLKGSRQRKDLDSSTKDESELTDGQRVCDDYYEWPNMDI